MGSVSIVVCYFPAIFSYMDPVMEWRKLDWTRVMPGLRKQGKVRGSREARKVHKSNYDSYEFKLGKERKRSIRVRERERWFYQWMWNLCAKQIWDVHQWKTLITLWWCILHDHSSAHLLVTGNDTVWIWNWKEWLIPLKWKHLRK